MLRGSSTVPLDGSPTLLTTTMPEADKIAAMSPDPNVLVMMMIKDGKVRSTRTYTVAPDGKSMSETATYLSDAVPSMMIHHFKRIP